MKTITIKKTWSDQSQNQDFSYTNDAPIGHIKRHMARELAYARKGQSSVMSASGAPDLKISLESNKGLTEEESTELKGFLSTL